MKALLLLLPLAACAAEPVLPETPAAASQQSERQRALMQRFDTNGDGQLDESEKEAARSMMGGGAGGPRGAQAQMMRERLMERFDANGDGTLNEAERSEAFDAIVSDPSRPAAQRILQRFDANGDGALNADEKAAALAAWSQMQDGAGRPGTAAPGGRPGARLTPEQREAILRRFDANGDGQLDDSEREAARAAWRERQRQGQPTPPADN